MADYGYPNNPIIRVIHLDSDIAPNEPGLVSVLDEATGVTLVQDAEPYLWKSSK
jgi:hypothetical protein